jgi:hypothetical protein
VATRATTRRMLNIFFIFSPYKNFLEVFNFPLPVLFTLSIQPEQNLVFPGIFFTPLICITDFY